jgi:hypothetical protein
MRDHLLNIEHKVVENVYTSIKDLRELKQEVASLRIRKKLIN